MMRYLKNDCPYGVIALDLSSIIDHEAIKKEFLSRLAFFQRKYESIGYSRPNAEIAAKNDSNFRKIIGSFSSAVLEFTFRNGFRRTNLPLNIIGVFYQAEFFITHNDLPNPYRIATYFLNDINNAANKESIDFFHGLEHGI